MQKSGRELKIISRGHIEVRFFTKTNCGLVALLSPAAPDALLDRAVEQPTAIRNKTLLDGWEFLYQNCDINEGTERKDQKESAPFPIPIPLASSVN